MGYFETFVWSLGLLVANIFMGLIFCIIWAIQNQASPEILFGRWI